MTRDGLCRINLNNQDACLATTPKIVFPVIILIKDREGIEN